MFRNNPGFEKIACLDGNADPDHDLGQFQHGQDEQKAGTDGGIVQERDFDQSPQRVTGNHRQQQQGNPGDQNQQNDPLQANHEFRMCKSVLFGE